MDTPRATTVSAVGNVPWGFARRGGKGSPSAGDGQPLRSAVVVLVRPRAPFRKARGAEGREIGGAGLAVDDPLGQAAADGGRRLERRPRVAQHREETRHRGDL